MKYLQCFRRDTKFKEGKTDLKDGPRPGQPNIAASIANMPFYRDYSVCQETPTFSMTDFQDKSGKAYFVKREYF